MPPVVIVESAFTRLHVQTAHTTRIKNYDGSDVTTTTTRHKDGVETVSEVTAWPDGRLDIHELVRNLSSSKTSKLSISVNKFLLISGCSQWLRERTARQYISWRLQQPYAFRSPCEQIFGL
jgi:hypothetical protein